jgi:two-component system response regulator GlrR
MHMEFGGAVMCVEAAGLSHCVDPEDAGLAARHHLPLLITAASIDHVERIARQVHAASGLSTRPLVTFRAAGFFDRPAPFALQWRGLLDAARGGSILINALEEMSSGAQRLFNSALKGLQEGAVPSPPRLMTGTTVRLYARVAEGEFLEELFYRLNVIHLLARDGH